MSNTSNATWEILFYITELGNNPVQEFLDNLPQKERAKADYFISLLQSVGVKISEPHASSLTKSKPLWELKPKPNRIFYCALSGRRFLLLHAFSKKKNTTDREHIELALKRYYDYIERKQ